MIEVGFQRCLKDCLSDHLSHGVTKNLLLSPLVLIAVGLVHRPMRIRAINKRHEIATRGDHGLIPLALVLCPLAIGDVPGDS